MRVHVPLLLVKPPEVKMAAMALLALLLHNVKSEGATIGLILRERSSRLEAAFSFASMVLNNNRLSGEQSQRYKIIHTSATETKLDISDNYKMGSAICDLLNRGVNTMIGTSYPSTFNTIQSYSHALHVPFILVSSTRALPPDRYNFDISIAPPIMDAVLKVISGLPKRHKLYFVYDSDDGLWRLQRLYQYFQTEAVISRTIDAFRIRNIQTAYSVLRSFDMKDEDPKTIVLDLESANAYRLVMEQIIDVGMNRDEYHYILAGPGALDLHVESNFFSQFLYGGVNITAFSFINNSSRLYNRLHQIWREHKDQYRDLFPITSEAALMFDAVRTVFEAIQKFQSPQVPKGQPIFGEARCRMDKFQQLGNGNQIMDNIKKVEFEGLTGPVRFSQRKRVNYTIDVYSLSFKQNMRKVETWKTSDIIHQSNGTPRLDDMSTNVTQRVTTIHEAPFVVEVTSSNGEPAVGGKHYEGYCIDLIKMIAKRVNFQYHISISTAYGSKNSNGSWDGMIGELVKKVSDIAVAPLTITEERERVVDFSKPFMNTGISIMIKKPDRQKPGVFSFMEPLDSLVWLCIAVGFLAVSFVLFFVGRFSPYEWKVSQTGDKDPTATNAFTISNTLWFSLGALMQQGSDISPRSLSGRIIGSAWWFFTLIIISSYTANLAAFLTIEKLISPIESADDLVNHPTIKYGTLKSGSSWRFFEDSTVPTFKRMKEIMLQNKDEVLTDKVSKGVQKVRNSKSDFAFLIESSMNNYHGQQMPCDVMRVGENLDNKGYGVATWIDHPLRHNINIAVLELAEIGELYKLEQKWWYDKGKCGDTASAKDTSGTQSALTLSNVSGIFHILIGGLVLSMLTSSIEYLVHRHFKSRKNKKHVCKAPPPPPPPPRRYFQTGGVRSDYRNPKYQNEVNQERLGASSHLMTYDPNDMMSEQTDI